MKYRGFTQKNNNNKVVDFYKDSTWEHLQFCLSYQFAQMGPWVLGWMVHAYKLLTKSPSFEDPDHLNFSPFFPCIVECGLSLYCSLQAFIGHQMFFFFFSILKILVGCVLLMGWIAEVCLHCTSWYRVYCSCYFCFLVIRSQTCCRKVGCMNSLILCMISYWSFCLCSCCLRGAFVVYFYMFRIIQKSKRKIVYVSGFDH